MLIIVIKPINLLNKSILIKKTVIILIITFCFYNNKAQNLVPNPSFELYKLCPTFNNSINSSINYNPLQKFCNEWESLGTKEQLMISSGGQYLNECAKDIIPHTGLPQSSFAYQYARTGKGIMVTAQTYQGFYQDRIYQGVKLIEPLKIGHNYLVRFYANLADSSQSAMNNLGITFYTQKQKITNLSDITSLSYPDWAHIYSKDVIDNKNDWVKIEGIITADSAYEYLVVGNFFDYNKTIFKSVPNSITGFNYPIYLLDDFTVEETKKTIETANKLICKGDSITLNAVGSSNTFYWSYNKVDTISTQDKITISINQSKTVYLVSNWGVDSVILLAIDYPQKIIPTDTFLCRNYYIDIDATTNNGKYEWNTGDTTPTIIIEKAGEYILKTTTGSCYRIDTLIVNSCEPTLYVPNAFTPNNDGVNDVFLPKGVQVFNYNLSIYSRWGQLIFQTNNMEEGWEGNGYTSDNYFYNITYSNKENTKVYQKSGNTTLIK